MSKEVENNKNEAVEQVVNVNNNEAVLERIKELNDVQSRLESKKAELETHNKDLAVVEKINGVGSNEWNIKNELVKFTEKDIKELEARIGGLVFKKSELKPTLDALTKEFEDAIRSEQEREYHIEIGTVDEETGKNNGKKIFNELLDYVQHDVKWTAKTSAGLMMLDRNLQENKAWVRSKEFDGVIILRSANVLVLWKGIIEDMHGKGSLDARKFLSVWANCGKGITDAVREINLNHENTRILGANLNLVNDAFDASIDDMPKDEKEVTTQEEVSPEV